MAGSHAAYKKVVHVSSASGSPSWKRVPFNTASLNHNGTMLDDTILGDAGTRSRITGLLEWSVSGTSMYATASGSDEAEALELIRNALAGRNAVKVRYFPAGTTVDGFQGEAVVENFNLSGGVDDLETIEISLQSTTALETAAAL